MVDDGTHIYDFQASDVLRLSTILFISWSLLSGPNLYLELHLAVYQTDIQPNLASLPHQTDMRGSVGMIVRTVHLSSDASRLVVGGES